MRIPDVVVVIDSDYGQTAIHELCQFWCMGIYIFCVCGCLNYMRILLLWLDTDLIEPSVWITNCIELVLLQITKHISENGTGEQIDLVLILKNTQKIHSEGTQLNCKRILQWIQFKLGIICTCLLFSKSSYIQGPEILYRWALISCPPLTVIRRWIS